MDQQLIQRAQAFAEEAHGRIEHRRKYVDEPYTVHLRSVAALVAEVTTDPELIAAAWLHDTVEDTDVTIENIEREFGERVASLVADLTDFSVPSDGNRDIRKTKDRAHTATASAGAKTVKLADLIDNSRSITEHDAGFAKVYMREKMLLLEVLKEGDSSLYTRAEEIVKVYYPTLNDTLESGAE